jgi:hypothetical protein
VKWRKIINSGDVFENREKKGFKIQPRTEQEVLEAGARRKRIEKGKKRS